MNNTAEIFEAHFPRVKPCHVVIEYCKPIYVKELSREDRKARGAYTQNTIRKANEKNKALL